MPNKKIAILVAQQDFRDEEYFIPKAVFEQQGIEVTTVSKKKGDILGVFGGVGVADIAFSDVKINDFDCFVFVGGSGAMKDLDNKDVYKIAQQAIDKDKLVGAICIASAILANSGVLKGKKATDWSSNMDK
ncbi:MAG: DJ-1/PfpI family protein [Parcubacteria group bacterium]|nr:DJ-1/PfpI family protein [Parcubacteria group bacterium]